MPLDKSVSIVIPCLNESETLALCIREAQLGLKQCGVQGEVVVADNGSTDGSQAIAVAEGARVVAVPLRGYGAALHTGILAARSEVVFFGDADMSYPFTELSNLYGPLIRGEADFVLGSRLRGTIEAGAMPKLNRFLATPFLSLLIRNIYGLPCSDCNSGQRLFLKSSYEKLDMSCPGMEYASEMLIKVAQREVRYTEVPISFRKDRRNRAPHLRRWRDGWRHLRYILGNAPTLGLIIFPLTLGLGFLAAAFFLSLWDGIFPGGQVHYHTAFCLIALATPMLLLTNTCILVNAISHYAEVRQSRLVSWLIKLSENAAPFYIAAAVYGLALAQVVWVGVKWAQTGFGELSEIDAIIRVMVFSILGTMIFGIDLGLGLIQLIPMNRRSK